MKKRSLKRYTGGGQTALIDKFGNPTPLAGMGGAGAMGAVNILSSEKGADRSEAIGSTIGGIGGQALNFLVPGLGTIAAPILSKLGGMAGRAISGPDKTEELKKKAEQDQLNLDRFNKSNEVTSNYTYQTDNFTFPYGGELEDPNAELELNEQFQTPDGSVGEVDGPSHAEGGVPAALPEGTRIFSDRLKHNGRTFAKTVKPINGKIAKLERQLELNPNDKLKENSIMLMNKQLDHYFNIQETNKQNAEMKRSIKYAKGGKVLPKYSGLDGKPGVINLEYPPNQPLESGWGYPEATTTSNVPVDVGERQPRNNTGFRLNENNYENAPTTTNSNKFGEFLGDNAGTIGQVATAGLTAALQNRNLNKLKAPRTLNKISLTNKLMNPNLVDYSAQRNDITQGYLASADSAQRNLSNSATAQAFKNQANLARLKGTGESWQNQENTNTGIQNQFLQQRNQAQMQEEMYNNEVDKYNLEGKYNYDAFKTGQKGALLGQLGNVGSQVFGNMTKYDNQLQQAEIMANGREGTVNRDLYGNTKIARQRYQNADDAGKAEINRLRAKNGMPPFSSNGGTVRSLKRYSDGGIHIKPENRGKFNATKEATGKTTEELTHSSNPVTRKRAIFAQNAAKWKH